MNGKRCGRKRKVSQDSLWTGASCTTAGQSGCLIISLKIWKNNASWGDTYLATCGLMSARKLLNNFLFRHLCKVAKSGYWLCYVCLSVCLVCPSVLVDQLGSPARKSCSLRDNVEKYGRAKYPTDYNVIRLTRFACYINKAINTHSEYVTPFPLVTRKRLYVIFKRTLPVVYKFVIVTFTESNRAVPTDVLFIDKKAECNTVNTHNPRMPKLLRTFCWNSLLKSSTKRGDSKTSRLDCSEWMVLCSRPHVALSTCAVPAFRYLVESQCGRFPHNVTRRSQFSAVDIRGNSITIVSRLRAGPFGAQNPTAARELSVLRNVLTGAGAHTASYSIGSGFPY